MKIYTAKKISLIKTNTWDYNSPSTPIIYLSIKKSKKILLRKHMAML